MGNRFSFSIFLVFTIIWSCNSNKENISEGKILSLDEIKLYAHSVGQGIPAIILAGSNGFDHHYLRPYLDSLSNLGLMIIYYDPRAVGSSPYREEYLENYDMDAAIQDINKLKKALGIKRHYIFSHSRASLLGIKYALNNEKDLLGLVLINPTPANIEYEDHWKYILNDRIPESEKNKRDSIYQTKAYRNGDPYVMLSLLELSTKYLLYNPQNIEHLDFRIGRDFKRNSAVFSRPYASLGFPLDLTQDIEQISTKTLVIHGSYDAYPLEASMMYSEGLQNAKLIEIPNSGHFTFMENHSEFIDSIKEFIED